jgi:uncharacterized protein with NRDE domain
VHRLQAKLAAAIGVRGRVMIKRGEPNLWMEVYEAVSDAARFEHALHDAVRELEIVELLAPGSLRHVECFEGWAICLILLAWRAHPDHPLILAANRDEFFARPTLPAAPWPESGAIVGGRDLEKGGSWLALSASGRLAAVTNFRDGTRARSARRSRGLLVSDFVMSTLDPQRFLERARTARAAYEGFNLLVAANDELLHYSNVSDEITPLTAGVHGLSNHLLDTPWPKVERGKAAVRHLLANQPETLAAGLFDALSDTQPAAEEDLPYTGVSLEWERQLASIFIRAPGYGTRASTVVLMERSGKLILIERNFAPDGPPAETRTLQLPAAGSATPDRWTFVWLRGALVRQHVN